MPVIIIDLEGSNEVEHGIDEVKHPAQKTDLYETCLGLMTVDEAIEIEAGQYSPSHSGKLIS